MAEPSQLPVAESLPRFMLAWLPVILGPTTILAAPGVTVIYRVSRGEGLFEVSPNVGIALLLGWILAFCCAAAASQWWALRRRLPCAGRWGMMTVAGFLGGELAIVLVGAEAWSVGINEITLLPLMLNPAVRWSNALAGILFGLLLGAAQSLVFVAPFRWSHRFLWIAVSAIAGILACVVGSYTIGNTLLTTIPSSLFSPLAWPLYALMTGIAMHRLIVWRQHQRPDDVAARFD
jgi:hypothetical protein